MPCVGLGVVVGWRFVNPRVFGGKMVVVGVEASPRYEVI